MDQPGTTTKPVTDSPPTPNTVVFPPPFCTNSADNSETSGGCGPKSPCADSGKCCSKWGWCGTDANYCDPELCCQNNCWGREMGEDGDGPATAPVMGPAPVPAMTSAPVIPPTTLVDSPPSSCPNINKSGQSGGCGPESPCADSSKCCSQHGWCGESADYCDNSNCCQSNCW